MNPLDILAFFVRALVAGGFVQQADRADAVAAVLDVAFDARASARAFRAAAAAIVVGAALALAGCGPSITPGGGDGGAEPTSTETDEPVACSTDRDCAELGAAYVCCAGAGHCYDQTRVDCAPGGP